MNVHALKGRRPLILVVDDDAAVRRSLARLLRAADLDVKLFTKGSELLAFKSPVRPRCLVLDLHLPDMKGLDLLVHSKAANPELPVVAMTGDLDPRLKARALQRGAAAFLLKPCEDVRFLEEVRRALGQE